MKYIDEFRDRKLIGRVAAEIAKTVDGSRTYRFMEVCGTHTMNIFRFGIRDLLPDNIRLISGPGCPVCVTPDSFLDTAIWLARQKKVTIATFGDMLKVPGSNSNLEAERAGGSKIEIVYSSTDAVSIAKENPKKEIIFLGIGFETTAPTSAQSILAARKMKLKNYSVLCGHKTMPEVIEALSKGGEMPVDGFLLPGHVSAIIGQRPYEFLPGRYGKKCVIAGFEPLDILQAILMLVKQDEPKVEIQYTRIIDKGGNKLARNVMKKVFEKCESVWRGIGAVKDSGLKIRKEFSDFDAQAKFKPKTAKGGEKKGCICERILKGVKTPLDCALFGKICNPEKPIGACMVSSEGTCAAYFKYRV